MTMVVKRVRSKVEILLPAVLCLIFIFSSCLHETREPPLPVNGVLDLRNWDFKKDGTLRLKGYWEFCFDKFLLSAQFDSLQEKNYSWVPGVWKRQYVHANPIDTVVEKRSHPWPLMPWENYYWDGKKMGATGFASYRLVILFPPGPLHLACKLSDEGTAYSFFINDSLAATCGKVGKTASESEPKNLSQIVQLGNLKDTTSFTFWVSNFNYRKGGLWKCVMLGDADEVVIQQKNYFSGSIFIAGTWFTVSFVMLFFFVYRPRERTVMLLMILSFACFIRIISVDERIIMDFIPALSFEMLIKLELISLYTMFCAGLNALCTLFQAEASKQVNRITTSLLVAIIAITLFTPAMINSYFVLPFQAICMFILIYSIYLLIKAALKKRPVALILSIATIMTLGFAIMEITYYNQITYVPFNMDSSWPFMFAFIQVILLARMFSGALSKVENFAGELEVTVAERTRELVAAQEQLLQVARQTENEKIRRRISQDIHDDISSGLNKISWMGELVKIKALKNSPDEINPALDKIIKASRETVDHLIEIIWSLNPASDDLENMLAFVRNYVNKFFDETPFNVRINFPEMLDKVEINPELKRNIFLVIKEALHNAAKYSKAENITLDFQYHDPAFIFVIKDDGVGIEEGVIRGSGHGMVNMQKRMESINGKLSVESEAGKGTRIILKGMIY
jgi:signal transduction histidine kinase